MRIGILTSSRADYGIYIPLLKALRADPAFELEILAFGTHLSEAHGRTIDRIYADGFLVTHTVDTVPDGDTPEAISDAMGRTMIGFGELWKKESFDLVIALGDRFEMFAACASAVPFNLKLAHIHGGEVTLGAIDNVFRDSITQMSVLHFTAAEPYRRRVAALKGSEKGVYNVGALSFDNLKDLAFLSITELREQFGIDFHRPSILITFHPETVDYENNARYADELIAALSEIRNYQLVITMPNSDTMGNMIREKLNAFIASADNAVGVESFGMLGYLSAMKHCAMLLGNTSSGFGEASFFPKYVINLGERQAGRLLTPNIHTCAIRKQDILDAVNAYPDIRLPERILVYGDGTAAQTIVSLLKSIDLEEL